MTEAEWDDVVRVHLKGHFAPSKFAASYWRKKSKETGEPVNAKIVNTASESGLYGNAGQVAYAAGKAALIGVTRTLAKEWGRYNVNVNAVAFGYIRTRMTQPIGADAAVAQVGEREVRMGVQPEMLAFMEKMIPLGRGGTPEEAAGAVYLLCIPEADYVSGQVLLASGGFVM